jgi:hypothetical protein
LVWLRLSRSGSISALFEGFLSSINHYTLINLLKCRTLPLIIPDVERNSLTGYWWFDMRLFEFLDELEMIKSFLTKLLILRTYWKELSVSLGSGCWRKNQIRIVCIMSGLHS